MSLKAPFPYFGTKKKVAQLMWSLLGDVDVYIEPFAGSLAVLLARPTTHQGTVEVVNDLDSELSNVWRALAKDPEAVASYAFAPVLEVDLLAKQRWILKTSRKRQAKLVRDPEYYDAKAAGWWLWGKAAWIGRGWCVKVGKSKLPNMGSGSGVHRQVFYGDDGHPSLEKLTAYLNQLHHRLHRVKVCTGDWSRVLTDGVLACGGGRVGIVLDPPYSTFTPNGMYGVGSVAVDDDVSIKVREWCIAHGNDPRLRIVLCGYSDEHEAHMPADWIRHRYSAGASYSKRGKKTGNTVNRHKERLWISPGCLPAATVSTRFTLLGDDV